MSDEQQKRRDRIGHPTNPADYRLAQLRRREQEDKDWAKKAGPVIVRKIDAI